MVGGAQDLFDTLFETLLNPFNPTPPDESGITFSSISSPYSLKFDNGGQDECSQSYNTSELYTMSSLDISCGVSAGFGYIHFSPPDDDSDRRMWELAYIEARFHPHGESKRLPRDAELVVRTDSVLPVSGGLQGEKSLTTLEYWADRRSDLHIHFHEDRSDLPESESDGAYGNTTDSVGWLRGMPAGSLEQDEIERAFRMLGSTDQPELPGDIPNELGLLIGIKNFTRDSSQNVDDPTLPINPADPPDSLIVVRSVQPLQEIDYTSWFSRGGRAKITGESTFSPTPYHPQSQSTDHSESGSSRVQRHPGLGKQPRLHLQDSGLSNSESSRRIPGRGRHPQRGSIHGRRADRRERGCRRNL